MIGLDVNAPERRLSYQSMLCPHEHLIIEDLAIGERRVTIEATGDSVVVRGDVDDWRIVDRTTT